MYFLIIVHSCFSGFVRILSFGFILVPHKSVICFTLSWNKDYIEKALCHFITSFFIALCPKYLFFIVFESKTKLSILCVKSFTKPPFVEEVLIKGNL